MRNPRKKIMVDHEKNPNSPEMAILCQYIAISLNFPLSEMQLKMTK
jgi:hypothetical protein